MLQSYSAKCLYAFACALRLSICAEKRVTAYASMCIFVADSIILIKLFTVMFNITFNCYDTIAFMNVPLRKGQLEFSVPGRKIVPRS